MTRALFALVIILAGCTASLPERIELRNIDTGTRSVKVVDQRPAEARVYREKVEGNAWKFLADDAFHPRVLDIVSARISTAIPDRNEALTVYLTRFDVGVFSGANCRDVAVGYNATRGAALGAEMVRGPVRALSCLSASESGIAFVEMKVGETQIDSTQSSKISSERSPDKAIAAALEAALDEIAKKASASAAVISSTSHQ
jgi:hypothetical protein